MRWINTLFSSRSYVLGIPYGWLLLFLLLPMLIILKLSFSEMTIGLPPYASLLSIQDLVLTININLNNYEFLFDDPFYVSAYINSLKVAATCTLICLFIGYPMAYCIARAPSQWQPLLLTMVVLPSWTSFLLRIYAWMGILQETGYLNQFLMFLGIIGEPIQFLYTPFAVHLGIVYGYLPFMILPIYVAITKLDWDLLKAAADLGAKPWKAFLRITLPLTRSGVIIGSLLVFIPAVGEFVVPDLLGGSGSKMIGRVMWQEFFANRDWPLAAALAVVMLLLLLIPIYYFSKIERRVENA